MRTMSAQHDTNILALLQMTPVEIALVVAWSHFHNAMAAEVLQDSPRATDEAVFRKTRTLIMSAWQQIALNEYLNSIGVTISRASNAARIKSLTPRMLASAALILPVMVASEQSSHVLPRGACTASNKSLCHNNDQRLSGLAVSTDEVFELLNGAATQPSRRAGLAMKPRAAQLVQQAIRRHKALRSPNLNAVRSWWGLMHFTDFHELTPDPQSLEWLRRNYESMDSVDAATGAIAEYASDPSQYGALLQNLAAGVFTHLRHSQTTWFEHSDNLSELELQQILNTTLQQVIDTAATWAKVSGWNSSVRGFHCVSCNFNGNYKSWQNESTFPALHELEFKLSTVPSAGDVGLVVFCVLWLVVVSGVAVGLGKWTDTQSALECVPGSSRCRKATSCCRRKSGLRRAAGLVFDVSEVKDDISSDTLNQLNKCATEVSVWHALPKPNQRDGRVSLKLKTVSTMQLHEVNQNASMSATDVILLKTESALLCVAQDNGNVLLFAPLADVQRVRRLHSAADYTAIDIRDGCTILLSGKTSLPLSDTPSSIGRAHLAPVQPEAPTRLLARQAGETPRPLAGSYGGPNPLQPPVAPLSLKEQLKRVAKRNKRVRANVQAMMSRVPSAERLAQVLGAEAESTESLYRSFESIVRVTRTQGISASAFAHLGRLNPTSSPLQKVWKQTGIQYWSHAVKQMNGVQEVSFIDFCSQAPDQGTITTTTVIYDFIDSHCIQPPASSSAQLGPNSFVTLMSMLWLEPGYDVQSRWLFSLLDNDHDGQIDFDEVKFILKLGVSAIGLHVAEEHLIQTTKRMLHEYCQGVLAGSSGGLDKKHIGQVGSLDHEPLKQPHASATKYKDLQPDDVQLGYRGFYQFVDAMREEGVVPSSILTSYLSIDSSPHASPLTVARTHKKADPVRVPTDQSICIQARHIETYTTIWQRLVQCGELQRTQLQSQAPMIIWTLMFIALNIFVCVERAQFYSRKTSLNIVVGAGVTIARAAAHITTVCTSCILLTRCGFLWSIVQGSMLAPYFPVNDVQMIHRGLGWTYLAGMLVHIGAHLWNFMRLAQIPTPAATCLLGMHSQHQLSSGWDWAVLTLPGLTGVIITLAAIAFFVFAAEHIRRANFSAFAVVHQLYTVLLVGVFMHGSQGNPHFWYIVGVPLAMFCVDKLIEAKWQKEQWTIVSARTVPGDTTEIVVKRAPDFIFQSGSYAQLTLPDVSSSSSHPFTIMSAPQELNIRFAIRSNGSWTTKLHEQVAAVEKLGHAGKHALPRGALIRGPYGAPTQRWFGADYVVLVGGGVGLTPMLATARDFILRHKARKEGLQHSPFQTKHMHFVWVTRTQKELQWLMGHLPDMEGLAPVFTMTIFLTRVSASSKLPLRRWFTPLLGLDPSVAAVRFGRPVMKELLREQLQHRLTDGGRAMAFVCGPGALVTSVKSAVDQLLAEKILPKRVQAFDEVFEW